MALTVSGYVIGGALNLRQTTSTSSNRLAQIPNGTVLSVTTVPGSPNWLRTTYSGYTGYVLAQYIAVTGEGGACKVTTASGGLNVRATPSSSATALYSAPQNSTLRLLDTTSNPGWYMVSGASGTGWAMSQYLTITTPIPGEGGGSSGGDTTDTDVIPPPTTQVTGTLSKGSYGSAVLALKQRLVQLCYYCGDVDSSFDIYTEWAVKYFQHLNGLSVTGSTNSATNTKLNAYGPNCGTQWGVDWGCRHYWSTNEPQQYYMNGGSIWANTPWDAVNTPNTETIGADGNCPTAFAMIASGINTIAITPPQVCQWTIEAGLRDPDGNTGVKSTFFAAAADEYEFIYHGKFTTEWDKIQEYLIFDNLVLVRVVGSPDHDYCGKSGATFLVINKIENGYVRVLNPNYNTRNQPDLPLSTWMTANWVKEKYIYGFNG